MITKYQVFYKGKPITEALELHQAMKHIEKLRCLFLGVHLQRVEVADGAD